MKNCSPYIIGSTGWRAGLMVWIAASTEWKAEIGALKEGQQKLRQELKRVSDKVYETYELALENWGQVQESKARLTALES